MGRATKSPFSLRSTKSRSALTRMIGDSPGGAWAWAILLAGIATSAAKSSAIARVISRLARLPDLRMVDCRYTFRLLVSNGSIACHRVWGDGVGLGMVSEGDPCACPPHGSCLWGGVCGVMGVYRDWSQLEKYKSGLY